VLVFNNGTLAKHLGEVKSALARTQIRLLRLKQTVNLAIKRLADNPFHFNCAGMRVLEYAGLETHKVRPAYEKLLVACSASNFSAIDLKKLKGQSLASQSNARMGPLYRAKLGYADRILLTFVRHQDALCVLMLEVILGHDYGKSKFLRGALVDEKQFEPVAAAPPILAAPDAAHPNPLQTLRYLHPQRANIYFLDRALSFDDAQFEVFQAPTPLILVGSAGSGKTALTLEKLKTLPGDVLYVTHSAYLASGARDKYFASDADLSAQNAEFLSYREFLETLKVLTGTEATWPQFRQWFSKIAGKELQAHQVFEEIRGVLCAQPGGALSRERYLALGVRQSIYGEDQRSQLYDVFEKYQVYLRDEQRYELSLEAHAREALATPRFDFVVIDEVQDLTAAQLNLVLKTLKHPTGFMLSGDANQIVHPNFFSWSQVKTLFWQDAELAQRQQLSILRSNFRNANATTELANRILKIKHQRFGSIDRESNYLIQASSATQGAVQLLDTQPATLANLNENTRQSTQFAVLVMRDEDKAAARAVFSTPLLFSVHEAKGLEYEHIVLFRFISDQRSAFSDIADGVDSTELGLDELRYARAKDKQDKALEIYKFYINAFYVAITRALTNVYVIESDLKHPFLALLALETHAQVALSKQRSSTEQWQREAQRLEQQGKLEQAEAIRRDVLKTEVPPWPVLGESYFRELLVKVFRSQVPGAKARQQLLDYAAFHRQPVIAHMLKVQCQFGNGQITHLTEPLWQKQLAPYAGRNFKDVLAQCTQFGTEHRTPMNTTPLMMAALAGNVPLLEALLERGAELYSVDQYGRTALHLALQRALINPQYAKQCLPNIYPLVAPASLDVQTQERLRRLDRRQPEYLLLQTMIALTHDQHVGLHVKFAQVFDTAALMDAWAKLPDAIVAPHQRKRSYISSVLSRNEILSSYANNRALFFRVRHGGYAIHPGVQLRYSTQMPWESAVQKLNLPLLMESTVNWGEIYRMCQQAGIALAPCPIFAEREFAERTEMEAQKAALATQKREELDRRDAELMAELDKIRRQTTAHKRKTQLNARKPSIKPLPDQPVEAAPAVNLAANETPPRWGTPAARALALAELGVKIAEIELANAHAEAEAKASEATKSPDSEA